MSTSDDQPIPRFDIASEGGLEESSHGALNPADDIGEEELPGIPLAAGELQLGHSFQLRDDLVLEVEHLFGDSAVFEGLDQEEIREVVNMTEKLSLQAGQALFHQGGEARALYIVQSGEVQVRAAAPSGEDILLAMLGPGTVVGELALIDGGPRSATVEALSDCAVYCLSRESFAGLRATHHPAAYKIILNITRTVDTRRRQTEARIDEVFEDPAQHIELFASQVHDMLARLRKA